MINEPISWGYLNVVLFLGLMQPLSENTGFQLCGEKTMKFKVRIKNTTARQTWITAVRINRLTKSVLIVFFINEMAFKPLTVSRCPVLHGIVLYFPGNTGHLATLKASVKLSVEPDKKEVYLTPALRKICNTLKYLNCLPLVKPKPMSVFQLIHLNTYFLRSFFAA